MTVKEQFIKDLIQELNNINGNRIYYENKQPLDVCYMVSVLDQHLDECKEFLDDISHHEYCINGYDCEDYTNGKIRVLIYQSVEEEPQPNYCYYIEFLYDKRMWGYCECAPGDNGYNEIHDCCGNGCDWVAPGFKIEKIITLKYKTWNGRAKDYWKYEEQFNQNEENKNKLVEEYEKQQEKIRLEQQMAEIQKKLNELN